MARRRPGVRTCRPPRPRPAARGDTTKPTTGGPANRSRHPAGAPTAHLGSPPLVLTRSRGTAGRSGMGTQLPVIQRGVTSKTARPQRRGEARLPAAVVVLAAIALYALLPDPLLLGNRFVIPVLGGLLLVTLVVINPKRFTRQTKVSRIVSLTMVGLIGLANTVA